MKYGYLIAYSDKDGKTFNGQPWIHPSNPLRKKDIIREYIFINNVVKAAVSIPFRVELNNIPEEITWNFVHENEITI